MIPAEADYLITALGLERHPEGGFYRESYRSEAVFPGNAAEGAFPAGRAYQTAIFFLLFGNDFSAFHRIRSDELWHFYSGSSLTITTIDGSGTMLRTVLGGAMRRGETRQALVRAGCWCAAALNDPSSYGLVGCTVSPGFDFRDFEIARRDSLVDAYPRYRKTIEQLTR